MHITLDITHPAHYHFFKNAIRLWQARGDGISIVTRHKDITVRLLEEAALDFEVLSRARQSLAGLTVELVEHSYGVWRTLRQQRADVVAAVGGPFIVYPAKAAGIPSAVFYDTEHARFSNWLAYPAATRVYVPRAYQGDLDPSFQRYAGFQELAYLHPNNFQADASKLAVEGLAVGEPFTFVRLVAWTSHHDINDYGVTDVFELVRTLEQHGRVLISAEAPLPDELRGYQLRGPMRDVHHILAHARLLFGESATMASEAAMLGVPSIFLSSSKRGYTDELEARYGLVHNFNGERATQALALAQAEAILTAATHDTYRERWQQMIAEQIDVTAFIVAEIDRLVQG